MSKISAKQRLETLQGWITYISTTSKRKVKKVKRNLED